MRKAVCRVLLVWGKVCLHAGAPAADGSNGFSDFDFASPVNGGKKAAAAEGHIKSPDSDLDGDADGDLVGNALGFGS